MKLYNTLGGKKEDFAPAEGAVKMYVCGVTPYDRSHLGHAMSYIIFDVLRRYLEYRGYQVRHVQNYTDIDDRIIARARQLDISPQELAERLIADYASEMEGLNVLPAHVYPRATQEIPTMIEMIST
ncbi:MAG: class I tRNA ligase family protein, partial [Dehalococcoidia bacterium]